MPPPPASTAWPSQTKGANSLTLAFSSDVTLVTCTVGAAVCLDDAVLAVSMRVERPPVVDDDTSVGERKVTMVGNLERAAVGAAEDCVGACVTARIVVARVLLVVVEDLEREDAAATCAQRYIPLRERTPTKTHFCRRAIATMCFPACIEELKSTRTRHCLQRQQ